jgi:hypothetical protein
MRKRVKSGESNVLQFNGIPFAKAVVLEIICISLPEALLPLPRLVLRTVKGRAKGSAVGWMKSGRM